MNAHGVRQCNLASLPVQQKLRARDRAPLHGVIEEIADLAEPEEIVKYPSTVLGPVRRRIDHLRIAEIRQVDIGVILADAQEHLAAMDVLVYDVQRMKVLQRGEQLHEPALHVTLHKLSVQNRIPIESDCGVMLALDVRFQILDT